MGSLWKLGLPALSGCLPVDRVSGTIVAYAFSEPEWPGRAFCFEAAANMTEIDRRKMLDNVGLGLKHEMNVSGLRKYDPTKIEKVIPRDKGLYIWWSRETDKAVYVGRALNRNGLLGRVLRQHLNPKYLEYRPDKTCNAKRTVVLNGKKACEKSVFRKAISEKYNLDPGVESVDYILKNFLVSFFPMQTSSIEEVKQKEQFLIEELKPNFNKQYQYHERDAF